MCKVVSAKPARWSHHESNYITVELFGFEVNDINVFSHSPVFAVSPDEPAWGIFNGL